MLYYQTLKDLFIFLELEQLFAMLIYDKSLLSGHHPLLKRPFAGTLRVAPNWGSTV